MLIGVSKNMLKKMLIMGPLATINYSSMFVLLVMFNHGGLTSDALFKLWKINWFLVYLVDLVEVWTALWMLALACLQFWNVYLPSYTIIYKATKKLEMTNDNTLRSIVDTFQTYRKLEVFTCLTNECFQNTLAIWLMLWHIVIICLTNVMLFKGRIRERLHILQKIQSGVLSLTICAVFLIGYGFSGQANAKSKMIKKLWKRRVISCKQNRGGKRELMIKRKIIAACQDIRIRFGSLNYFEKTTGLIVIHFVVEKTAGLLLLS